MRKLIMKMSMTLDGFVANTEGVNNWIFKNSTPESQAWSVEKTNEAGMIIMGRKSFESMSAYWPTAPGPFAKPMNELPKAVFTQTGFKGIGAIPNTSPEQAAGAATWTGARVMNGDLAEELKALKAEPGKPILAIGGAGFMRSLIATGLVDEYQLIIHPVVLGSGMSIFTGVGDQLHLKLVDTKTFPGGIVAHTYRPA